MVGICIPFERQSYLNECVQIQSYERYWVGCHQIENNLRGSCMVKVVKHTSWPISSCDGLPVKEWKYLSKKHKGGEIIHEPQFHHGVHGGQVREEEWPGQLLERGVVGGEDVVRGGRLGEGTAVVRPQEAHDANTLQGICLYCVMYLSVCLHIL